MRSPPVLLLLAFLPVAPPAAHAAAGFDPGPELGPPAVEEAPTAEELERLGRGETVTRLVPAAGSGPREGVGMRVVAAPPERVFRAVEDYAHYHEFMPFMTASEAEARPGGGWIARQVLEVQGGVRKLTVATASAVRDTPGGRRWHSSWSYVPGSGDVRDSRGRWTLSAFPGGGTLVVLRMLLDTGAPVFLQDRATVRSLGWVLDGLRQQVDRCRYDDPPSPGCPEAASDR